VLDNKRGIFISISQKLPRFPNVLRILKLPVSWTWRGYHKACKRAIAAAEFEISFKFFWRLPRLPGSNRRTQAILHKANVLFICFAISSSENCLRVSKTECYCLSRICFEMTRQAIMPSSSEKSLCVSKTESYGLGRICFEMTRPAPGHNAFVEGVTLSCRWTTHKLLCINCAGAQVLQLLRGGWRTVCNRRQDLLSTYPPTLLS
jgi:hypothetical protein